MRIVKIPKREKKRLESAIKALREMERRMSIPDMGLLRQTERMLYEIMHHDGQQISEPLVDCFWEY